MKTKKIVKLTLLLTLFVTLQSMTSLKGLEGTWEYEAPTAAYEYSKGEIIIKKVKDNYELLISATYDDIKASKVEVKGNTITFDFDVEGMSLRGVLKMEGDTMKGSVDSPEGEIELTCKRKKS